MIQIEITNGFRRGPLARSEYPCIIRVIESTRVFKTNWVREREEKNIEQKRNNEPIHDQSSVFHIVAAYFSKMQLSKYAFAIKTSSRCILHFNEPVSLNQKCHVYCVTNVCMHPDMQHSSTQQSLRKNFRRNFSDLCSAIMAHSKM